MYCCAISLTSGAPENWARIGREWNVRCHLPGMLHRETLPQRWQVKLIRASIKYEINAEIWYDRSCRVVPAGNGNVLSATVQRGTRQTDRRKLTTVVSCQLSCGCIKREAISSEMKFQIEHNDFILIECVTVCVCFQLSCIFRETVKNRTVSVPSLVLIESVSVFGYLSTTLQLY